MSRTRGYNPVATRVTEAEFTRPANATQYTAGDAVGTASTNVLTFSDVGYHTGAAARITALRILKSDGADVTGASFRLHLYKAAPTAVADNSANAVLYAERTDYIGYIDTGTMVVTGGAAIAAVNVSPGLVVTTGAAGVLYGALEAVGTYTPASAETFSVGLTVEKYS